MRIAFYLTYIPYIIIWYINSLINKKLPMVFYCHDLIDWYAFQPVYKYLPEVVIVSDKNHIINYLRDKSINVKRTPSFPGVVIMCRNYLYKFPCKKIKKIGVRNSPYQFKRLINHKKYNDFDLYLFTSKNDASEAMRHGITIGKAVGYPKLDPAFDGTYNDKYLSKIRHIINLDIDKTTVLFTTTWYKSDMSAVFFWCKKLGELVKFYNVLVSVHPWMDKKFIRKIKQVEGVIFLNHENIIPYIMISDLCISDTSSAIAECCALDKPIITFKVRQVTGTNMETEKIVENISYRINHFPQIIIAVEYCVNNKSELSKERQSANSIFFDKLDGDASMRAAREIKKFVYN